MQGLPGARAYGLHVLEQSATAPLGKEATAPLGKEESLMGLNVVTVCHRHEKAVYSMRGEEHVDLQRLMRTEHRQCMKEGQVRVYCDADIDHGQYEDFWPYEERPAATGISDPRWTNERRPNTDA